MQPSSPGRACAATLLAVAALLATAASAWAQSPVSVYPLPGTEYNRTQTQISFRGVPAGQIGPVQVTGSVTGAHSGHIAADSDGQGGSFIPDSPFAQGETVTVRTNLDVVGGSNGTFSFQIAHDWGLLGDGKFPVAPAGSDGVQHFVSRPDLQPAAVAVTENHAPASDGDIFVAPQNGPAQNGPMILDSQGNLVWFDPYPVSQNTLITDFKVQDLGGQPVLTWWQGNTNAGHGRGVGVIFNQSYQQIATVRAANGLDMGLHEFRITPQGDAYITASSPVHLSGVGKPAIDSVVQEIDIKTGLVLFDWHALDHIPLNQSYFTPKSPGRIFDPYHINSVALAPDGNLIVSMRNTSAIYEINRQTGQIMWTLGGKASGFKMGSGTPTWGQHDAVVQADGTLTVFDDGAGPPKVHPSSRGIRESLDTSSMTARLIGQYGHSPQISANFEGSVQPLSDGNLFLGWGQQPYFSEVNSRGQQIFDAHFNAPTSSYRAYRFPWSAHPPTQPATAMWAGGAGDIHLYASWNGATDVSGWRVLGGTSPGSLSAVGGSGKRGFETEITAHDGLPYFAVQAVGSRGQILATSPTRATGSHIALFGRSAFVASSAMGGLPAICYLPQPCHISTSLYAGRTLVASTGREYVRAGGEGLLFFRLSRSSYSTLVRYRRLGVHVVARDSSGTIATTNMTLVPFRTSGAGPHRSLSNGHTAQIDGVTDFVNSNGWGGILGGCFSATPCHLKAAVSVGSTTIATTGPEFVGANELGYTIFHLTPAGQSMLAHAAGNQLGARVTLANGTTTASADIALVRFS